MLLKELLQVQIFSLLEKICTGKVSAAGNSRRNGIRDMSQQNMRSILAEKARKVICKKLDEWKKDHATIIALHQTQPKSLIFSPDSLQ